MLRQKKTPNFKGPEGKESARIKAQEGHRGQKGESGVRRAGKGEERWMGTSTDRNKDTGYNKDAAFILNT